MLYKMINYLKKIYRYSSIRNADLVLIFLIVLSVIISFFPLFKNSNNQNVKILKDQIVISEQLLTQDNIVTVDSLVVIEIKNGKARISFSTCRNQHCVHQGWSDSNPIICVPNRVIVDFGNGSKKKKQKIFITR